MAGGGKILRRGRKEGSEREDWGSGRTNDLASVMGVSQERTRRDIRPRGEGGELIKWLGAAGIAAHPPGPAPRSTTHVPGRNQRSASPSCASLNAARLR